MISLDAVLHTGVHEHRCALDVRTKENFRVLNRTVHMALCSKIHDHVRLLFLKKAIYLFPVADVTFHETEIRVLHDRFQCGKVSGIGQFVEADDPVFRVLPQLMKYEIASDKTGTAGDEESHYLLR